MKRMIIYLCIVGCLFLSGCQSDEKSGEPAFIKVEQLRFGSQTETERLFTPRLRGILMDGEGKVLRLYDHLETALSGDALDITLPVGRYVWMMVAGGEMDESVSVGLYREEIMMKTMKGEEFYNAPEEYSVGVTNINLSPGEQLEIPMLMERKVGRVRLTLQNIAPEVTNLQLLLKNVPGSYSPEGRTGSKVTIIAEMERAYSTQSASATLFSFPFSHSEAVIGVRYTIGEVVRYGEMTIFPSLTANTSIRVTGQFIDAEQISLSIGYEDTEWFEIEGGNLNLSDSDVVIIDNRPCEGESVSENLLQNGGFEEWENDSIATGWLFHKEGSRNRTSKESEIIYAEHFAARLDYSTYLYQNIPVIGGECYRVKMRVLSTADSYKWRIFNTWRTSEAPSGGQLGALYNEAVQSEVMKSTEGWISPFGEDLVVRAPYEARYLRIEIRTYTPGNMPPTADEGVFIDGFEVSRIE